MRKLTCFLSTVRAWRAEKGLKAVLSPDILSHRHSAFSINYTHVRLQLPPVFTSCRVEGDLRRPALQPQINTFHSRQRSIIHLFSSLPGNIANRLTEENCGYSATQNSVYSLCANQQQSDSRKYENPLWTAVFPFGNNCMRNFYN